MARRAVAPDLHGGDMVDFSAFFVLWLVRALRSRRFFRRSASAHRPAMNSPAHCRSRALRGLAPIAPWNRKKGPNWGPRIGTSVRESGLCLFRRGWRGFNRLGCAQTLFENELRQWLGAFLPRAGFRFALLCRGQIGR